jgi:hypothetical protein
MSIGVACCVEDLGLSCVTRTIGAFAASAVYAAAARRLAVAREQPGSGKLCCL